MNICLVNTLFPPIAHGGTEAVVQLTAELLLQAGHQVSIITTQPDAPEGTAWSSDTSRGYTVYRFRPKNIYYYTEGSRQSVWKKMLWHAIDIGNKNDARVLRQLLEHIRPDVVHGHNLKGMSYTLPSVCASLGIPYVHSLHNYQLLHPYGTFLLGQHPPLWTPKIAASLYQSLCRRQFRQISMVISPTTLPLELHRQAGFFQHTPAVVLPTPAHRVPTPPTLETHDGVRFVYLGALEPHKGILDLLLAVQHLPTDGWSLDIYGQGSLETAVATTATQLPNVRCLGFLEKKEELSHYDALIYPSRCYETQGLSMAEALSYGTPVIAANIGSIHETINDRKNGLLYEAGNVRQLTQLLQDVLQHPDIVRNMRTDASATATLSVDDYRLQLLSTYRSVVR